MEMQCKIFRASSEDVQKTSSSIRRPTSRVFTPQVLSSGKLQPWGGTCPTLELNCTAACAGAHSRASRGPASWSHTAATAAGTAESDLCASAGTSRLNIAMHMLRCGTRCIHCDGGMLSHNFLPCVSSRMGRVGTMCIHTQLRSCSIAFSLSVVQPSSKPSLLTPCLPYSQFVTSHGMRPSAKAIH